MVLGGALFLVSEVHLYGFGFKAWGLGLGVGGESSGEGLWGRGFTVGGGGRVLPLGIRV